MTDVGEIPIGGKRVLRKPGNRKVMGTIKRTGPNAYQALDPGGNLLRPGGRARGGRGTFDDYNAAFDTLRYYHGHAG